MSQRIENVSEAEKALLEPFRPQIEATLGGFVPNSLYIMAHDPQLVFGFGMLSQAVFRGAKRTKLPMTRVLWTLLKVAVKQFFNKPTEPLSDDLRALIFLSSSLSAGCHYCQAHSVTQAVDHGVSEKKLADLMTYQESPLYTAAERAVLDLSFAAGAVPNRATDEHFDALRQHFSAQQIVDIVAAIAYMGFLNRWNDTLATEVENRPKEMLRSHLP